MTRQDESKFLKGIQKVDAQIANLNANAEKLSRATFWHPLVVSCSIFVAVGTFFKVLDLLN